MTNVLQPAFGLLLLLLLVTSDYYARHHYHCHSDIVL